VPFRPGAVFTVWVVPLSIGDQARFRGDDGSAEPRVAAALAAFGSGQGSEHAALCALAGSRLLVPIVATAGSGGDPAPASAGGAKDSEVCLPTLVGHDGRRAIPVFTSLEAMARWRRQARPVPTMAGEVWRADADDGCAVVVDVAGPVPAAVDGARLAALAAGRPVPMPHEDPDVLDAVSGAATPKREIAGFRLAPGGDGADLEIRVTVRPGCAQPAASEAIRLLGTEVMAALGSRLRRGIAVTVTPPPGHRGA
jgi:hypothetical protein